MVDEIETPIEDAPPKKGGSKLMVILIAVVVLAAGAGGGFYFFTRHNAEAAVEEGSKKEGPKAPAVYVKFEPPFVVNFETKGVMRFLQVTVEAMTRDPVSAGLLKQHDALVRNDLLMLFGSQPYDKISNREGKEQLRAEALAVVAKVIKQEGGAATSVEQLYFTSFVMQ